MSKSRDLAASVNDGTIPGSRLQNEAVKNQQVSSEAEIQSSKVVCSEDSISAVERLVESKLRDHISILDFVPPGIDTSTEDCTAYIQNAVNFAISSKKPLKGAGRTYMTTAPINLGGTNPSGSGLVFDGENCLILQTVPGQAGIRIAGRSSIVVRRMSVQLPVDLDGSGAPGLLFSGLSGWNRIEDCNFNGGLHGIFNNNSGIFATVIEKCKFFNHYGSHFKWISSGSATTISLRNCMGDGVTSTEPAFYVLNPGSGNGIENLEMTMCSSDNCVQAFHVQSRYLFVNNLYVERVRGAEWQNNFSVYNFPATFEPGFIHGLRCTFATPVPAGLTNICALRANGQILNSIRLGGNFSASPGNSAIITGGYVTQIHNVSNFITGAYGIKAGGPVFGCDNGNDELSVDPTSAQTPKEIKSLLGVGTSGTGSGNNTGSSGVIFGVEGFGPPPGSVSNGTFQKPVLAYSALLPYSPGGGVARRGGLRVFVNPSTAQSTTPVNCATWDFSGNYQPGSDDTFNLGSSGLRWKEIFAANGVINTSDSREKEQVRDVSDKEKAVALKLKKLLKAYKFVDAVKDKGEDARIHFGVLAQDLQDTFSSEGLDAEDYGLFCYDNWEDEYHEDENGDKTLVKPAGNRYGIRYNELFAFMISAL